MKQFNIKHVFTIVCILFSTILFAQENEPGDALNGGNLDEVVVVGSSGNDDWDPFPTKSLAEQAQDEFDRLSKAEEQRRQREIDKAISGQSGGGSSSSNNGGFTGKDPKKPKTKKKPIKLNKKVKPGETKKFKVKMVAQKGEKTRTAKIVKNGKIIGTIVFSNPKGGFFRTATVTVNADSPISVDSLTPLDDNSSTPKPSNNDSSDSSGGSIPGTSVTNSNEGNTEFPDIPVGDDGLIVIPGGFSNADDAGEVIEDVPPPPPGDKDPCKNVKAKSKTQNHKNEVTRLKGFLGNPKEQGSAEDRFGDIKRQKPNPNEKFLQIIITINGATRGMYHSHPKSFVDEHGGKTIVHPIFSPEDVNSFLNLVSVNNSPVNPNKSALQDVFSAIVTKDGTFFLKFSGTQSDIIHNEKNAKRNKTSADWITYSDNTRGKQLAKFIRFVNNVMKIKGLELIKINNEGDTTSKIKLDPTNDRKVTETEC